MGHDKESYCSVMGISLPLKRLTSTAAIIVGTEVLKDPKGTRLVPEGVTFESEKSEKRHSRTRCRSDIWSQFYLTGEHGVTSYARATPNTDSVQTLHTPQTIDTFPGNSKDRRVTLWKGVTRARHARMRSARKGGHVSSCMS